MGRKRERVGRVREEREGRGKRVGRVRGRERIRRLRGERKLGG